MPSSSVSPEDEYTQYVNGKPTLPEAARPRTAAVLDTISEQVQTGSNAVPAIVEPGSRKKKKNRRKSNPEDHSSDEDGDVGDKKVFKGLSWYCPNPAGDFVIPSRRRVLLCKVYLILSVHLILAIGMLYGFLAINAIRTTFMRRPLIAFVGLLACLGPLGFVFFSIKMRSKFPYNQLLIAITTICGTFSLSTLSCYFTTDVALVLMIMFLVEFVAYAILLIIPCSFIDFTNPYLQLVILGIFQAATNYVTVYVIYDGNPDIFWMRRKMFNYIIPGNTFLLLLLTYHTKFLVGGQGPMYETLTANDPFWASTNLYLDFMGFVFWIRRLLDIKSTTKDKSRE